MNTKQHALSAHYFDKSSLKVGVISGLLALGWVAICLALQNSAPTRYFGNFDLLAAVFLTLGLPATIYGVVMGLLVYRGWQFSQTEPYATRGVVYILLGVGLIFYGSLLVAWLVVSGS